MITKEELSDKCWETIKEMASSYQQPEQKSEEEEEGSAMTALMKSTDEETERQQQTCQGCHRKSESKAK